MLDAFRRLTKSKLGVFVFALFIAAIAFGFAAADIQNIGVTGSGSGDAVAKIGDEEIGYAELQDRVQRAYENARRDRPDLTIQQFVRQGGVDQVVAQMSDAIVLEQFAKKQGFGVNRKMEDGQIAAAPAFRGLTGQFDQQAFESFLQQQRVSEKAIRADIAREMYLTQLLVPTTGAAFAPASLTLPYASMLLEQRQGRAQLVPAAAFRGTPPTDAEIAAFYRRNVARYTIPERRVIRYALISRAPFEAAAQPSEQEIAVAYNADKARYAGRETRTISQVIVPTEAAARDLAAKIGAGTPIAEAARAIGLESVTLNNQTREAYAQASSAAVANAVFTAAQGQIAPPARSGLGWHVARVDAITNVAGKSLDQARPEIVTQLKTRKADEAWAEAIARVEEAVNDGGTFDEVVAANKLQAATTPALLADGRNPDSPAAPPAAEIAAIVKSGFAMEAGDDPVVEQIAPNQTAALVKTEQVLPATPRPLNTIREQVVADLIAERSLAAARRTADMIAAKINAGAALAQAASGAGVALPSPTALSGRRGETLRASPQPSPQLAVLFSTRRGKARIVPASDASGWYVVTVENIVPGDARGQPQLVEATRQQFAPVLGQEYGQQLAAAARKAVGVEINRAAVERLKRELTGAAPASGS
jgi:peptidyl-prolyl cis-trans isomerase D